MEAVPKALRLTIHRFIDFRLHVPIPLTVCLVRSLGETPHLNLSTALPKELSSDPSSNIVGTNQPFHVIVQPLPRLLLKNVDAKAICRLLDQYCLAERVEVTPNFHSPAMQHWGTYSSIFSTAVLFSEQRKQDRMTLSAAGRLFFEALVE
jgi:hypothetical protein